MISAIVLVRGGDGAPERSRELAVRSLAWLVPAVVAGVVRDVVAACPPGWAVSDIMDHAGCALVQGESETARLTAALPVVRCERVLVVAVGYHPEGPLVAEIDALEGGTSRLSPAVVRAAPRSVLQRLYPDWAPVVGVIVDRERTGRAPATFAGLVREARTGVRLRTRMVPVM